MAFLRYVRAPGGAAIRPGPRRRLPAFLRAGARSRAVPVRLGPWNRLRPPRQRASSHDRDRRLLSCRKFPGFPAHARHAAGPCRRPPPSARRRGSRAACADAGGTRTRQPLPAIRPPLLEPLLIDAAALAALGETVRAALEAQSPPSPRLRAPRWWLTVRAGPARRPCCAPPSRPWRQARGPPPARPATAGGREWNPPDPGPGTPGHLPFARARSGCSGLRPCGHLRPAERCRGTPGLPPLFPHGVQDGCASGRR